MSEQLTDTDFVRVCRLDELPPVGATLAEINGRRVRLHPRQRLAVRG